MAQEPAQSQVHRVHRRPRARDPLQRLAARDECGRDLL